MRGTTISALIVVKFTLTHEEPTQFDDVVKTTAISGLKVVVNKHAKRALSYCKKH